MSRSNAKNDFVMPIAVLTIICLIASAILVATNNATAPVIAKAEAAAAAEARAEVLPEADGFEEVEISGAPDTVTGVYKANNGCGYVVQIVGDGYGGKGTLSVIVGIDSDGKITASKVMAQNETPGLGTKIMEEPFNGQFVGKDSSMSDIQTISGATISSNHYIDALNDAFAAYEIAKEVAE